MDEQEYLEIKKHPKLGADSIQSLKGFENIVRIINHHHERFDGTGYPDGLSRNQIPKGSIIISIADVYDALLHDRAYRKAMSKSDVIKFMKKEQGTHFDPDLMGSFIKFIEKENRELQYDSVCGMSVNHGNASLKFIYQNQTYYFCSQTCMQKFNRFPAKYTPKSLL